MGKIRALSEELIGKIAAGEVVERPVAAVKELCENSLDAGATAVTVEIREDPCDYLRITDNGSGIEEADLRMAFARHATSKIRLESDLDAIETLGFRGEALASIAAVSRVTLITRTAGKDTGVRVQNEGGQIIGMEETACSPGTTIIVRDLFYNTPVRKNFLRKPGTEAGAITDLVARLILSREDVRFRLICAGKTVYQSPGDGKLASAVHAVFGSAALRQMRPVNGTMLGMRITGFVGIGELGRNNRNNEYFFVNQRMMRSGVLSAALENACRERVMIGKFPTAVLQIEMPFEQVNVNVHPNKLEVRFQNERAVCEAMETVIREALQERDAFERPVRMTFEQTADMTRPDTEKLREAVRLLHEEPRVRVTVGGTVPEIADTIPQRPAGGSDWPQAGTEESSEKSGERAETRPAEDEKRAYAETTYRPDLMTCRDASSPQRAGSESSKEAQNCLTEEWTETAEIPNPAAPDQAKAPAEIPAEQTEQIGIDLPKAAPKMKIFGALFDTYILIEYDDQLMMVDQHAVHERLLFDRLMDSFGKEKLGQEMLTPLTMSVTKKEMRLIEENRDLLEGIGLTAEPFGETDIAVRSMPMILGEVQIGAFVRDVLGELEAGHAPSYEKKRIALLQTACKHAVKGGEKLGEDQLRHLIDQMIGQKVTPTCPHGRPLVVSITHRELDKKFKRIQD